VKKLLLVTNKYSKRTLLKQEYPIFKHATHSKNFRQQQQISSLENKMTLDNPDFYRNELLGLS
jgi:hypothetical protein